MSSCEGKTALVTDGSRGIGRAAAIALAKAGAQVLVHYHRGASKADQVVSEIRAFGGRADTIGAAISSADGPHDLARRTRAIMGDRLDILVLSCSSLEETPLATVSVENFDSQFTNNVRAPLFLIQQLLPILGSGSSVVFTLASPSNERDVPAYITSRGALEALVPHLASALAARGVRVNALAHARGDAQDAALAVTFLASNEASSISGDTLRGGSLPQH
jgi:NAD(P)-dependent dehydrogenase (short-subunit alcohol dehydrogenase family)